MSNAVKWMQTNLSASIALQTAARRAVTVARLQLAGCVLGLAALAFVLPLPGSWPAQLSGLQTVAGDRLTIVATAEQAVLLAASALVWVLLVWSTAVAGALTASALPGLPGR